MSNQMKESKKKNRNRRLENVIYEFKHNKQAMFAAIYLIVVILISIFVVFVPSLDPDAIDVVNKLQGPSAQHWFGTDNMGRDYFARVLYGGRISLVVGVLAMLTCIVFGVVVGTVSGYFGGIIDSIIMRIMDGMLSFPYILLAMVLMTVLGSGIFNVILAVGIGNIPSFARVVRGEVYIVKKLEYCNAARVIGVSKPRMLFTHILPNTISPLIVYATLGIAGAIISEAALSFLGLGISEPTASWGSILQTGKFWLNTSPHIATYSGIFILITVLGFNLLGDGVRDVLDPKMKK